MRLQPCPTVRDILAENSGVLRLEELLEETAMNELDARRVIDELALAGEVKRMPVGDHVMLKCTREPPERQATDADAHRSSA